MINFTIEIKCIMFLFVLVDKLNYSAAQIEYLDDQGRYIFDAPLSIRNRQSVISNGQLPNQNVITNNRPATMSFNPPTQVPNQSINQVDGGMNSFLTSTTARPRNPQLKIDIRICFHACPTTNEFNPVCGSDGISYANLQKLTCAQRCGQNVIAVRQGRCRRFGPIQN